MKARSARIRIVAAEDRSEEHAGTAAIPATEPDINVAARDCVPLPPCTPSSLSPLAPPNSLHAEELFLSALPLIDRISAVQATRNALTADEHDEYIAWVHKRLRTDNCATLRKFAGRSSLSTFLTVVLVNLFLDYQNMRWGRWRPSAAAVKLGPLARRLEELLYRDRYSLREAAALLCTSGLATSIGEVSLLAARIPSRRVMCPASIDANAHAASALHTSSVALETDREQRDALEATIRSLVPKLDPEDAVVLKLRFWSDMNVADIARTLHLDEKALYRRVGMLHARLRSALEARGLAHSTVMEILRDGD